MLDWEVVGLRSDSYHGFFYYLCSYHTLSMVTVPHKGKIGENVGLQRFHRAKFAQTMQFTLLQQ